MNEIEQSRPVRIDNTDKTLLIVDDDKPFLQRLARAMESRGFIVDTADSVSEGMRKAEAGPPPQHAPPHIAADTGEAGAAVVVGRYSVSAYTADWHIGIGGSPRHTLPKATPGRRRHERRIRFLASPTRSVSSPASSAGGTS